MSDETVAVPVALLRELREFGVECWTILPWQIKDLIALIPPPPWSPSDEDVTAYCEAYGLAADFPHIPRKQLIEARKRGWDIVPRRLNG